MKKQVSAILAASMAASMLVACGGSTSSARGGLAEAHLGVRTTVTRALELELQLQVFNWLKIT